MTTHGRLALLLIAMTVIVSPASAAGVRVRVGPHGVGVAATGGVGVIGGVSADDDWGWDPWSVGPAFLIVDALPPHADVLLDGRPVGTAGELVAHGLRLEPGEHEVEIAADGFERYVAVFDADPMFPTRVRVMLPPVRARRVDGGPRQP
jgi:PEGA domain-containing protein